MMTEAESAMRALHFLIGEWKLDYTATQHGVTSKTVSGVGSMRYLFEETYLTFDYRGLDRDTGTEFRAHGIFAWDAKTRRYRYFWFEDSGTFLEAVCALRDERSLEMEWQGVDCTQIFERTGDDMMYLEMRCPSQDLLLRVDFTAAA
jgi:hypothetical protein